MDSVNVNNNITAKEVRVIDAEGAQLGILGISEALRAASLRGFDLVEVSPGASPPVCKMMDYGKYQYDKNKKDRKQNAENKSKPLKQVRLGKGLRIEENDLLRKIKKIEELIAKGHKVLVTMQFKGREIYQKEEGLNKFNNVKNQLGTICNVDSPPSINGRSISMTLSPAQISM